MISRRARWLAGLGLLLLGALGALSWAGRRRVYRTVASSEAVLDAAGAVPGIPASRLLSILDSLGIQHSARGSEGTIFARVGRSFDEFMIHGDIRAEFTFDSTGRLLSRQVREVLTGP